jgi:hypothetical protein
MSIQETQTDLNDMYQLRDLYNTYMFDNNTININSLDYELTHTPIVKSKSSNSLYLNCNETLNTEKDFIHVSNNNNNNTPPFMLHQNINIPNPPYLNLDEIIKIPSITPKFVQTYEDRNNAIFRPVQNNITYIEKHQPKQLDLLEQWKNNSYKYIFDTYQKIVERQPNLFPFNKDYGDKFFDTTTSNSNSDIFDSDIYESDVFDSDVFDLDVFDLDLEKLSIGEKFNFKQLKNLDYTFNEIDSLDHDYAINLQTFGNETSMIDMEISKIVINIRDQQNKYEACLFNSGLSIPCDLKINDNEEITNKFCTIGSYSKAVRNGKIDRYRAKRSRRNFTKHVDYAVRKTHADSRVRVNGRFTTTIK